MNAVATKSYKPKLNATSAPHPVMPPQSFNELALRYVASHAHTLSDVQLNRRMGHLGQHLMAFFGPLALADISPTRVQKFSYQLAHQGVASKDIEGCLVSFRACMKYAFKQNWPVPAALLQTLPAEDALQQSTSKHHLSDQEFSSLYQDLLQDMSTNLFH